MKKIIEFIKQELEIFIVLFVVIAIILVAMSIHKNHENSILILDRENPALQNINKTLTFDVAKYQTKILILEEKIKDMETLQKQQAEKFSESTENLEYQIIKTVEETQDTSLIVLFDEVKNEQKKLIENYEKIIELKDSVILEKDNVIKSYVLATESMSNEIERLHAENNELLINEMMSKGKIKKRNKIIVVGSAIVVGGITTLILLNK